MPISQTNYLTGSIWRTCTGMQSDLHVNDANYVIKQVRRRHYNELACIFITAGQSVEFEASIGRSVGETLRHLLIHMHIHY